MPDPKPHTGGCHCGAIRYEVTTDLTPVISCNCSICSKKGTLLTFVDASQFRIVAGSEDALTDYQFNKHVIHHLFCPKCGVTSFARGMRGADPIVAINVRCLDDVDVSSLATTAFDGKSR